MNEKNNMSAMFGEALDKIRTMADTNTIIGEPIHTPDGVTLIPVNRMSYGFGCGGGDYGNNKFGGGCGGGIHVDPVAFLVVKDGVTRIIPVGMPPVTAVGRAIDLVPQVMDRVESYLDKKKADNGTF